MCGVFGFMTRDGQRPRRQRSEADRHRDAEPRRPRLRTGVGRPRRAPSSSAPARRRRISTTSNDAATRSSSIGHCRWATHGSPEDNRNNHPHPAGQESAIARRQMALAISAGDLLDGHAAGRAIDAPHRVQQEHRHGPQRHILEAADRQTVVARPRPGRSRSRSAGRWLADGA